MEKLLTSALLIFLFNNLSFSQIGKVGINTDTPAAMLHVKDSSVLFTGLAPLPPTPGPPPATGAGTRMMWYADKAAFRTGRVEGTQWNKDSIGLYSLAAGLNIKAKGQYSVAFGHINSATGISSVVMGSNNKASGNYSFACGAANQATGTYSTAGGFSSLAIGEHSFAHGLNLEASGDQSFALGNGTTASGFVSLSTGFGSESIGPYTASFGDNSRAKGGRAAAFGDHTYATGYASMVIGSYNDSIITTQVFPSSVTPIFIIGNGDANNSRSNALVVRKDGRMGLGTNVPFTKFHLRNGIGGGMFHTAADMIIEDAGSSFLQFSNPNASEAGLLSGDNDDNIRSAVIFRSDDGIDLRTGGNNTRIRINSTGDIDMMSGEVQRTPTGNANLVPICYGAVNSSAVIQSGTGNFTVTNPATGRYNITITGEDYISSNYSTSVSPISTLARIISCSSSAGNLVVYIFDAAGAAVDNGFQFVVYQQ